MYPTKGAIHKVIVLRTGALGDVLAVRGVLRFVREILPSAEITLVAPGERGRLFLRPGWADHAHDWDRAAFSWLFSHGRDPAPATLRAIFSRCDWLLSYIDPAGGDAEHFEARLDSLAPAAAKVFCPSRPVAGEEIPIGEWLVRAALGFCRTYGLAPEGWRTNAVDARLTVAESPELAANPGEYAVMHPGSGSPRKNWPLDNYCALGRSLLESGAVKRLVVTSGEADGELGERLASKIPGSDCIRGPNLEKLAQVLAHARLYVGNDSGVSHLAAAVRTEGGRFPKVAAFFGPSDPAVWAPPGALVLRAGEGMDELDACEAWKAIREAALDN